SLVVDRAGQPVLANAAYERILGADADAVPETDSGHPIPPEATPQRRAARGESFSMEFTLATPDGGRRWYEASGQPIQGLEGEQAVVVIRDITDRSVRRLQDEFLAMASHELRT